jgi:DNA-binding transcriptional MerR regulator
MWVSELSEKTQLPVDTIKHYLRIGVLHKGVSAGPLRAEYDESHVARLRLIQAMTEIGEMRLDTVRRIFASLDETQESLRDAVGPAHYQLSRHLLDGKEPSDEAKAMVDRVIADQGWDIHERSVHRRALGVSIDALINVDGLINVNGLGLDSLLDEYAGHMGEIADFELKYVDTSSRDSTLRSVIIGTVLYEPLMTLLRRMADEHASHHWEAQTDWIPKPEVEKPPGP